MKINRIKPFDPKTFIGVNWSIESQDEKALTLTDIDWSKVVFEHGLKEEESYITGEEKLKRLEKKGTLLDAAVAQQLYEEDGQKTLHSLYDEKQIDWMEFAGTVLRYSYGDRYFLCLDRNGGGSWLWDYRWLDDDRRRDRVSPLLASSTQSSDIENLHSVPLNLERAIEQVKEAGYKVFKEY